MDSVLHACLSSPDETDPYPIVVDAAGPCSSVATDAFGGFSVKPQRPTTAPQPVSQAGPDSSHTRCSSDAPCCLLCCEPSGELGWGDEGGRRAGARIGLGLA